MLAEVRHETPVRRPLGKADIMTVLGLFTTDFTALGHGRLLVPST